MSDDTSIFGAQPEKLDRLFLFGLESPEAKKDAAPMASIDIFTERVGDWIDRYRLLEVLGASRWVDDDDAIARNLEDAPCDLAPFRGHEEDCEGRQRMRRLRGSHLRIELLG